MTKETVLKRYLPILLICVVAVATLSTQVYAQGDPFDDPRVLGGTLIRDLAPSIDGFEEAEPSFVKSGQSGLTFLAIPTDAHSAAMGDAGTGVLDNAAGAIFNNPALLAFVHTRQAFFSHVEWIGDTSTDAGGLAFQVPGIMGTFGIGFVTWDSGDINGTAINTDQASEGFTETGTFSTTNYGVSGGWGFQITDRFAVGANVRIAHQDLGAGRILASGNAASVDNTLTALAVDLGTYFNTGFRNTVLAMSVQNFSEEKENQRERFELPRSFRLGVTLDLVSLYGSTPVPHHIDLALELDNAVDFDERFIAGVEYRYRQPASAMGFALRGGYKFKHDTETFSVGGGVRYRSEAGKGVRIDYAYKNFNSEFFDAVQMITGGIEF
jgi:hypothetical protein